MQFYLPLVAKGRDRSFGIRTFVVFPLVAELSVFFLIQVPTDQLFLSYSVFSLLAQLVRHGPRFPHFLLPIDSVRSTTFTIALLFLRAVVERIFACRRHSARFPPPSRTDLPRPFDIKRDAPLQAAKSKRCRLECSPLEPLCLFSFSPQPAHNAAVEIRTSFGRSILSFSCVSSLLLHFLTRPQSRSSLGLRDERL